MARIFISYARKDGAEIADEMADRLRARGHTVFLDVHSIRAGSDWQPELTKNVKKCDVMVVLVTSASNDSDFVYKEIESAKKHHKTIIPVRVEDTPLPRDLRGNWQAVTLKDDNLDHVLLEIEAGGRSKPISPVFIGIAVGVITAVLVLAVVFLLLPALNKRDDNENSPSEPESVVAQQTEEVVPPAPTLTQTITNTSTPGPTATLAASPTIIGTPTLDQAANPLPTVMQIYDSTDIPTVRPTSTQRPTSTPRPTSIPFVAGAILINEDFEDGKAQGFTVEYGSWKYETDETGNTVLASDSFDESTDYASIRCGRANWDNYIIEYKFRLLNHQYNAPNVTVYLRRDSNWAGYVQSFLASGNEILLAKNERAEGGWISLASTNLPIQHNTWYSVKIVAERNYLQIFVNNAVYIQKNIDFRSEGFISFEAGPGTYVQFDNIVVTALEPN